jgi:hypothetical protein
LNCNCAVDAERGGKDKMWWEGGDGIGMGWDGEGRISVWRSGRKERVFSSGTDKSMIYQPTFVDSIEADAYRTGQDRTGQDRSD